MGSPRGPKALVDHVHLAGELDGRKNTGEDGGKGLEIVHHSYKHSLSRITGVVLTIGTVNLQQEGVDVTRVSGVFVWPVLAIHGIASRIETARFSAAPTLTPVYLAVIHVEASRSFQGLCLDGMYPFFLADAPLAGDGVPGRFTDSVLNGNIGLENPAKL